jgi:hypothetical protein
VGKPTAAIDWDRAFAFFASLDQTERSYPAVAQQFSVSLTSVKKHGKAERWIERAEALDKRAVEQANRRVVKSRSERIADAIECAVEARAAYVRDLKSGEHKPSGSEVAALTRTEALLEGEATDRIELSTFKSAMDLHFDLVREMDSDPQKDFDWFLGEFERRFVFAGNGSSNGG